MVLTDGISYHSYDDADNSGSDPNDLTGNGNNGITNGATTGATGKINEGFSFDGVNDYVDNVFTVINSDHFSISYWYKSSSTSQQCFVGSDGDDRIEILHNAGATGVIRIHNKVGDVAKVKKKTNVIATLNDGNFHHVVIYFDQQDTSGSRVYFDDVSQTLNNDGTQGTGTIGTLTFSLYWGACHNGGTQHSYVNGSIDEPGTWDREITAAEVTTLFNSGAGFNPFAAIPSPSGSLGFGGGF